MKNETSIDYKNGNAANRNRDKAIIGFDPVLKCKCEMPAKIHGKNLCWRCKRLLF